MSSWNHIKFTIIFLNCLGIYLSTDTVSEGIPSSLQCDFQYLFPVTTRTGCKLARGRNASCCKPTLPITSDALCVALPKCWFSPGTHVWVLRRGPYCMRLCCSTRLPFMPCIPTPRLFLRKSPHQWRSLWSQLRTALWWCPPSFLVMPSEPLSCLRERRDPPFFCGEEVTKPYSHSWGSCWCLGFYLSSRHLLM